jgi:phosphatidylserine/phosphatidylglycerophosphate/cardiolipin synthase-like enzyme
MRNPAFIDAAHAIAPHDKVILLDGTTVIGGSFNFSGAAEDKNAENLLIVRSEDTAKFYGYKQNKHKDHSWKH